MLKRIKYKNKRTMQSKVLSFDIGIKNLAWCVTTLSGEILRIDGWGNYNLQDGQATETPTVKVTCSVCKSSARFQNSTEIFCARHCPPMTPPVKDVSGNLITKMPPLAWLRAILKEKGVKAGKTKADIITAARVFIALPIEKVKVKSANTLHMSDLHDAIRLFIDSTLKPHFQNLTEVRFENQPVLKNPVMKTVQVLLYATMRDFMKSAGLSPFPECKLVHASTKVKGQETGDKGYKARKEGSETRAEKLLTSNAKVQNKAEWLALYKEHKKKSDLADALCMCLDAYTAFKNA